MCFKSPKPKDPPPHYLPVLRSEAKVAKVGGAKDRFTAATTGLEQLRILLQPGSPTQPLGITSPTQSNRGARPRGGPRGGSALLSIPGNTGTGAGLNA